MYSDRIKPVYLLAAVACLCLAPVARGVPVSAIYTDDPAHCDNHGDQILTHELGDTTVFPADEALFIDTQPFSDPAQFKCEPDDGITNDWVVRIVNLSGQAWMNVFFVADEGYSVGNYDGGIADTTFPPAPAFNKAFRIDGTVTPGVNNPLAFESMTPDEILEVGESWEFYVTNFTAPGAPTFKSVGKFSASSGASFDTVSNASILATPVPEPASLLMLGLGGLLMLRKRPNTCRLTARQRWG